MASKSSNSTIFYRWVVANTILVSLLGASYVYGFIDSFLVDQTFMTHGIGAIFVLILLWSGKVAWDVQREFSTDRLSEHQRDYHKTGSVQRSAELREILSESLSRRLALIHKAGPFLVALGLVGTVVGISHAIGGIDASAITNPSASQATIATLVAGLSTAFHTTLAGIVGMIWNTLNLHMLQQEVSRFFSEVIKG